MAGAAATRSGRGCDDSLTRGAAGVVQLHYNARTLLFLSALIHRHVFLSLDLFYLMFLSAPTISRVEPAQGPVAGNRLVTISGTSFGDGSDITAVSLANYPARIVSQTSASVVVVSSAAGSGAVRGPVSVTSVSRGTGQLTDGYEYMQGMLLLFFVVAVLNLIVAALQLVQSQALCPLTSRRSAAQVSPLMARVLLTAAMCCL